MTDRKKPGVAFWATVVVAVVLAYPISFGPAIWLIGSVELPMSARDAIRCVYAPLIESAIRRSGPISRGLYWWAILGSRDGWAALWEFEGQWP